MSASSSLSFSTSSEPMPFNASISIAFTICEKCGKVAEISDEALETRLRKLATEDGFTVKRAVVEMRGLCADCR